MTKINWTLSAALVAAACIATPAMAQDKIGSFHLPMAAHFGATVLEPGDYNVSRLNGSAIRISGEGGIATMLAMSTGFERDASRSALVLVNTNGGYAVKQFDSGVLGLKFDFPVSKSLTRESERASIGQPGTIDIALK